PAEAGTEQRLRVLIQEGAETLGEGAKLSAVNAAWRRLTEHPELYRPTALVALANGTLDLRTRSFQDWSPDHICGGRSRGVTTGPGTGRCSLNSSHGSSPTGTRASANP